MSGISSSTGIFSGIDSATIIEQLLSLEARPKILAQRRIAQLQQQQASYLDLNAKLQALKTAAAAFRVNNVFQTNKATSSNADVLTATASTSATPGTYQFIVDRLVSTQQFLSRGFSDSSTTGVNAGTFTFEPAAGRLDRQTMLADLNGGNGVERGKITVSDSAGKSATIDLSRAATVDDVLDAFNSAAAIDVTASVEGGRLVITSNSGANLSIVNAFGSNTAASLGIETPTATASTITGSTLYTLGAGTALSQLNDGNGIFRNNQTGNARFDFTVAVNDGTTTTNVNINIGDLYDVANVVTEPAPTTLGGILTRINAKLESSLGNADLKAEIAPDGLSLRIVDAQGRAIEVLENTGAGSTTAADLGLKTSAPQTGTVQGVRILSGLNTTLARTLNGGQGITGDGTIAITGRDGAGYNVSIDTGSTLSEIIAQFSSDTAGKITARLNSNGTGLEILDNTGGTASNLIISGTTAESLGIDTDPAGVALAKVAGTNLQHQYITLGTQLSTFRNGQGVGTGKFTITDSLGEASTVNVGSGVKTVDDLIRAINAGGNRVQARLNSKGDGIELFEDATGAGTLKIKVADSEGSVAANLGIKGESASAVAGENVIDGSMERKVTFAATDTLAQVASKITAANVGVTASIINDGAGSTPFRLSISARNSGSAGRMIIDTGAFDLGLTRLDEGHDARVFFGSADPARAVLLSSSRNTLDNVVSGVTIDLNSVSTDPVSLTINRDSAAVETAINTFVDAFNQLTDRIAKQTRYDKDTEVKAPLLGDSTALTLGSSVISSILGPGIGLDGTYTRLSQVGLNIGAGGKLQFNRDQFRQALEDNPEEVAALFAARDQKPREPIQIAPGITAVDPDAPDEFNKLGLMGVMEQLSESYINSVSGVLTRRGKTLTEQIDLQTKRIANFDIMLENKRVRLSRQFLAMEQAIGRLQSQQGALGQISSLG